MFLIVLFIAGVFYVAWYTYNVETKGKAQLKSIEACISQIERNPNSPSAYDKFIGVWNSSNWVEPGVMFNRGYYDRILKICYENSSDAKVWGLLIKVVQKLNVCFATSISISIYRNKTCRLLADSLFKEFENLPVRERILSLIHLIAGITQVDTQYLYNTSLKILETNSNSQEAKIVVLDLGRLHYSILRPENKPTIYDEQAIQNDIIVRSQ